MFRNTGANAFAKNQTRLTYEDKLDLYCNCKYDVCQLRGLSVLSGDQFPPMLCGRVGEAAPLLVNK